MDELEIQKQQYEALKAAYRLFGSGDLMKFWLFEKHRCINKWAHYFPIYRPRRKASSFSYGDIRRKKTCKL